MVAFHVRNYPHIPGILAEGIARVLPCFRPFEVLLPRVLLRHPHNIQVEEIILALGEPKNTFITPGEAPTAMKSVLEVPDNAIPALKPQLSEYWEQHGIQRNDHPIIHVVSYFPANASCWFQGPRALVDDLLLLSNVVIQINSLFVLLAQIVRWRSNHQLERGVRDGFEERKAIPGKHHGAFLRVEGVGDLGFLEHCGVILNPSASLDR